MAEFIPMFVLALPAGQLADRVPRRLIFAGSLVVGAGVSIGLAVVSNAGTFPPVVEGGKIPAFPRMRA